MEQKPSSSSSFEFHTTRVRGKEARYLKLSESGEPAHFFGANGFPLGSYRQLLEPLSEVFQLNALSLRACWPGIGKSKRQTPWSLYADDLIAYLDEHASGPIVAIGHSQGASSSVLAATKRPDLFKALILFEPASMSPMMDFSLQVVPYFIKKPYEPFKSALKKQEIWPSKGAFYDHCREMNAFRRIGDDVLRDFVEHGLTPTDNGKFRLVFPADWEASNYTLAKSLSKYLVKLDHPIHVYAGKPSLFFSQRSRDYWKKNVPNIKVQTFSDYGHLLPLEAPALCAEKLIEDWDGTSGH